MLGEVVGCDEGQYVRLEAFEVFVVEDFDRGVFDGSVHSLCLAVGPGVIGLGQPVLDPMFDADAIEDVAGPRNRRLGPSRFLGRSAKAIPLSVSTVWGKAATTFLRKAAPSFFPALAWNST